MVILVLHSSGTMPYLIIYLNNFVSSVMISEPTYFISSFGMLSVSGDFIFFILSIASCTSSFVILRRLHLFLFCRCIHRFQVSSFIAIIGISSFTFLFMFLIIFHTFFCLTPAPNSLTSFYFCVATFYVGFIFDQNSSTILLCWVIFFSNHP